MNAVRLKSQHTRPEVHQWRFSSYLLMETGCLGWVVSYLPWPNNIHRGPTLFGTLKSFFPTLDGKSAWVDHGGLRHGGHMAPFYSQWSPGVWGTQLLNVHRRF